MEVDILYSNIAVHESCSSEDTIRLTQFTNNTMGRLEVCSEGRWGSICGNLPGQITDNVAIVACRQLNYAASGIYRHMLIKYGW